MPRPHGRTRRSAQIGLYETTLDNPELEAALKTRESMKDKLGEARHNFKVADDAVQPLIEGLDLGVDVAVRVGDFLITRKQTKVAHVEFERGSRVQTRIKQIDGE